MCSGEGRLGTPPEVSGAEPALPAACSTEPHPGQPGLWLLEPRWSRPPSHPELGLRHRGEWDTGSVLRGPCGGEGTGRCGLGAVREKSLEYWGHGRGDQGPFLEVVASG